MNIKILKAVLAAMVLAGGNACGIVSISYSFSPSLKSGNDLYDLAKATWEFTFTISETNYESFAGYPRVIPDSAELTITGASSFVNGTYDIMGPIGPGLPNIVLFPNFFGTAQVGAGYGSGPSSFDINGLSVTGFEPTGAPVASPSSTGLVMPEHFNGIVLSSASDFTVSPDTIGGTYSFSNATVTAVPEPGTSAALAGLIAIGIVAYRRSTKA